MARTKYKKPKLPEGLFVLVGPADVPNSEIDPMENIDGPLDSGQVVVEDDGTHVFLTEGFPYVMKLNRQRGDILEMEGYTGPVRIERWPIAVGSDV